MYDIDISVCPTRWASFQTAFELLSKCIPSNMLVDMKIVQFITATILQVEANHIDHSNWDRLINELKTNLRNIFNDAGDVDDRAQLMLQIIESREDKYMTTHNKISNFYKQIDPLIEQLFQQVCGRRLIELRGLFYVINFVETKQCQACQYFHFAPNKNNANNE
ncbi:Hypothetical_protein [Hexamita inflata]|uniref:Hypothetical_protein n=1 Tax=Hexamita inflata TaxID=28002 RepID=A0AA86QIR0_9EUKA|nr:Hypothetical protein HINF_LOCUS47751 [Hexamita inflata]